MKATLKSGRVISGRLAETFSRIGIATPVEKELTEEELKAQAELEAKNKVDKEAAKKAKADKAKKLADKKAKATSKKK